MQENTTSSILTGNDKRRETPLWLNNFVDIYQSLSVDNLSELAKLYHHDISFQDPLHRIKGLNSLVDYFNSLYQNVSECTFVINQVLHERHQAAIYWTMTYSHKHLNGGKVISVEGSSMIIGENDKVIYHRDYIDIGQMIYEHVPVLGGIIRWLKLRVSK